ARGALERLGNRLAGGRRLSVGSRLAWSRRAWCQGTNRPCVANSVLSWVEIWPSGPPSKTCAAPSSQIERLLSGTAPGIKASAVVVAAQVLPPIPVAVQGIVTLNGKSLTVPGSV